MEQEEQVNCCIPPDESDPTDSPEHEAFSSPDPDDSGARRPGRRGWRVILHEHRRLQFARAALVGIGAGAIAVLFQYALTAAEDTRMAALQRLHAFPWWGWAVLPILGGLLAGAAGWLTARYAPEAAGSGIPHIKGWNTWDGSTSPRDILM